MHDIKVFLEKKWKFWVRIKAWKEIIYWVWENQEDLIQNLKQLINWVMKNDTENYIDSKILSQKLDEVIINESKILKNNINASISYKNII